MKRYTMLYVLMAMLTLPNVSFAQGLYKPCDSLAGFQYGPDQNARVGFITKLEIPGQDIRADIPVLNPENPDQEMAVFAVLQEASWSMDPNEPIQIAGQVSVNNKKIIDVLFIMGIQDPNVVFQFVIYEYDPDTKQYYKAMQGNEGDLRGMIAQEGLMVGDTPSHQVQDPENYPFSIVILPNGPQQIHLSVGPGRQFVRQWGM